MMCLLKKNAVIFKVGNDVKDQDPIVVIQQKIYTNEDPDSCVPLLGIYDGTHYQSVYPASKRDEKLTEEIIKYFPDFQGNFKAFFKDNIIHQKHDSSHDEPVSEQKSCDIDGQNRSYEKSSSEQENSEIDGQNGSYEESSSEQENSETDGQNSSYEESPSKQENSEIDGQTSSYEEYASIFLEEAMLFIKMQEKKYEKRVRQRIRAQVN